MKAYFFEPTKKNLVFNFLNTFMLVRHVILLYKGAAMRLTSHIVPVHLVPSLNKSMVRNDGINNFAAKTGSKWATRHVFHFQSYPDVASPLHTECTQDEATLEADEPILFTTQLIKMTPLHYKKAVSTESKRIRDVQYESTLKDTFIERADD